MRHIRVIKEGKHDFLENVHTATVRMTTDGLWELNVTGETDLVLDRGDLALVPTDYLDRTYSSDTVHYFQIREFNHDRLSGLYSLKGVTLTGGLSKIIDVDVPKPEDPPEGWVAQTHRNATIGEIMNDVKKYMIGKWEIFIRDNEDELKIDYNMSNKTVMEVILELAELFGFLIEINNDDSEGSNSVTFFKVKTHFHYEEHGINIRNMSELKKQDSDRRIFTHLLLTGKDGLTIESVNGSKWLVDEITLEKLGYPIYEKFSDGRFTIAKNLMNKGLQMIEDNRKESLVIVTEVDNLMGIKGDFKIGDRVFFSHNKMSYDLYIMQIDIDLVDPERHKIQIGGAISSSLKAGSWESNVTNNIIDKQLDNIINEMESKDYVMMTNVNDTLIQMGTSLEEQKDSFMKMFADFDRQTEQKITDLNNEFDRQLLNAPKMTVEWMNKNVGILNGETVMINSIKSKHIAAYEIESVHIKTDAVTADKIKVDDVLANQIMAKTVISDLIMAGTIAGNNGYWNLDTGEFKTQSGDLSNIIHKGEFVVKDDGVTTMKLDGLSLRLYDKTQIDELVGRMYASTLTGDSGTSSDMGHFSIRHAFNKSLGIAGEVSTASTNAETYIMFDNHNRSILTERGYPITVNKAASFRDKIFMRWNDIWLTDTFVITPHRSGISFINDSTKRGLHLSASGYLYERNGNQYARVQLGSWGDL